MDLPYDLPYECAVCGESTAVRSNIITSHFITEGSKFRCIASGTSMDNRQSVIDQNKTSYRPGAVAI